MILKVFTVVNDGYLQLQELYFSKELALIGVQLKSLYSVNSSKYSTAEITIDSDKYIAFLEAINTKESMLKDIEDYHTKIAVFNKEILPEIKKKLEEYES